MFSEVKKRKTFNFSSGIQQYANISFDIKPCNLGKVKKQV